MREARVERYLVKRIAALGGRAYKFTSPGRRNVPDRIVVMPGGGVTFVECKRPGAKPRPGQAREMKRLREYLCTVVIVDSVQAVDRRWPTS